MGEFAQPVVYSVSIEGGKKLGGIQQLPQNDKTQLAPPKNVAEPEPPKAADAKKEEAKKEEAREKETKKEDAEVSLQEKPTPAAKPTEPPKATPKPEGTPAKGKEDGKEDGKGKKKNDFTLSKAEDKQLQNALQRYLGESSNAGGEGFGAAALGPGNGMGGGVVRPPEFFIYFNILKNHVYRNWRWPGNAPRVAWIRFNIAEDGTISNVSIDKSSGDSYYDDLAYRAIVKANPAPPPPKSVYEFFKDTRFILDSKGAGQIG